MGRVINQNRRSMEANRLASNTAGFFNFVAVCSSVIYQKVISPVKGFSCAHRCRHGGLSCSEYVKQVVLLKCLTWLCFAN